MSVYACCIDTSSKLRAEDEPGIILVNIFIYYGTFATRTPRFPVFLTARPTNFTEWKGNPHGVYREGEIIVRAVCIVSIVMTWTGARIIKAMLDEGAY